MSRIAYAVFWQIFLKNKGIRWFLQSRSIGCPVRGSREGKVFMINQGTVYFAERNIRGAWVVYGAVGVRQYYGYSKREALRRYKEECGIIRNMHIYPDDYKEDK